VLNLLAKIAFAAWMQFRQARQLTNDMAKFWRLEKDSRLASTVSKSDAAADQNCGQNKLAADATDNGQSTLNESPRHTRADHIGAISADSVSNPDQQPKIPDPTNSFPTRRNPWTLKHSFFALMGGFAVDTSILPENQKYLHDFGERVAIPGAAILFLAEANPHLIPDISLSTIQDKSKASDLAKAIVCVQASWFSIQTIYRLADGLSISLLELNTLGHALCALLIYCFWWSKPLDIQEPYLITKDGIHDWCALMMVEGAHSKGLKIPFMIDNWHHTFIVEVRRRQPRGTYLNDEFPEYTDYEPNISDRLADHEAFTRERRLYGTVVRATVPSQPEGYSNNDRRRFNRAAVAAVQRHQAQPLTTVSLDKKDEQKILRDREPKDRIQNLLPGFNLLSVVELFHYESSTRTSKDGTAFLLGLTLAGLIYGGLHELAWQAPFTSHAQKLLWRICATALTASGGAVILSALFLRLIWDLIVRVESYQNDAGNIIGAFVAAGTFMLVFLAAVFYLFSRAYLVIECFLSLAYLPDAVFQQPRWNGYFPHIG